MASAAATTRLTCLCRTVAQRAAVRVRGAVQHSIPATTECLLVAAGSTRSYATVSLSDDDHYVSPISDFVDKMERNGPTTLGTTPGFHTLSSNAGKLLKCGVPESALRFSTTSFGRTMAAPFVHPNEHRVVMKVNSSELPLQGIEKDILREIVGARLNDDRNELRLTSNQFGSRIENKRHLVTMLDRIVLSCQRLAKEIDDEVGEETTNTAAA